MSHIDIGRPFFLPGMTSLDRQDRSEEYFPAIKNLQRGMFSIGPVTMPYYMSRAKNERALLVGCSGLNTHVLLEPEEVKKFNDAGISVIWLALPPIRHHKPFVDDYLRVAGEFFTSKHSPANHLFPHDLQRHAITHSTGGQLFWTLKQNEAMQQKLHRLFSSEIHIAPYLDSANASRRHSSTASPSMSIPAKILKESLLKRFWDACICDSEPSASISPNGHATLAPLMDRSFRYSARAVNLPTRSTRKPAAKHRAI